jgi:hypothetical protein
MTNYSQELIRKTLLNAVKKLEVKRTKFNEKIDEQINQLKKELEIYG